MKHAAYLVGLPPDTLPRESVFLDVAKAVDYAARHHGSVAPLVRASEAETAIAKLAAIQALVTTDQESKDQFIARVRAALES